MVRNYNRQRKKEEKKRNKRRATPVLTPTPVVRRNQTPPNPTLYRIDRIALASESNKHRKGMEV